MTGLKNTMKKKISISIEEELIENLEKKLHEGIFRNRSHIVEFAIKSLIDKDGGKNVTR